MDQDGYVQIVGRIKDMIIDAEGMRIYALEDSVDCPSEAKRSPRCRIFPDEKMGEDVCR